MVMEQKYTKRITSIVCVINTDGDHCRANSIMFPLSEDLEKLSVKHSCSDSSMLSSIIGIDMHCSVATDVSSTDPDCSRKSSGAAFVKHELC